MGNSDYLITLRIINELENYICSNLCISRKRLRPVRTYNSGINVEVVISERDLGIVISNDTSWKARIVMIVAKANKMLGFLKSNYAGILEVLRFCDFTVP